MSTRAALTTVAIGLLAILSFAAAAIGTSGAPKSDVATQSPERDGIGDFKSPSCLSLQNDSPPPAIGFWLSGECSATIADLTCTPRSEDLFVTGVYSLDGDEKDLVVTALVPGYDGAGDYDDVQVVAQVTDVAVVPRWSTRATVAHVDDRGVVSIDRVVLRPEVGTPSSKNIAFQGVATCEVE